MSQDNTQGQARQKQFEEQVECLIRRFQEGEQQKVGVRQLKKGCLGEAVLDCTSLEIGSPPLLRYPGFLLLSIMLLHQMGNRLDRYLLANGQHECLKEGVGPIVSDEVR